MLINVHISLLLQLPAIISSLNLVSFQLHKFIAARAIILFDNAIQAQTSLKPPMEVD